MQQAESCIMGRDKTPALV